uniref:Uncharacterized protein n=1 Tax=Bionectria ochroleuca TaxID=29856 RepID=A0A0B7JLX7_BIOOC
MNGWQLNKQSLSDVPQTNFFRQRNHDMRSSRTRGSLAGDFNGQFTAFCLLDTAATAPLAGTDKDCDMQATVESQQRAGSIAAAYGQPAESVYPQQDYAFALGSR